MNVKSADVECKDKLIEKFKLCFRELIDDFRQKANKIDASPREKKKRNYASYLRLSHYK